MTPQELKNSILQQAIQGKLVEQRPEEGTAEELYQQIQAEKQRLIKEKKIKKDKPLPEITDDEKPFDIPDSWKWVRINDCWKIINGDRGKNYPAKSTLSHTGIPFISALNLDGKTVIDDDNLLCLSDEQYDRLGGGKLIKGDVVVCIRGSLGKHGKYPFEKGAIASSLVILRGYLDNELLSSYLMLYLDCPLLFMEIRKYDNGTAQPNLSAKNFEQFLFPLPPLAEQKRIVAKIEELLPLIDRYEAAWTKLEAFNKRFPEDMQKSILQQAIQGKLVEQRPEEGTGEELYQQIQAEKQALIKAKKIKKDKPLPEITDDEKPFDIPESWKWVRLGDISVFQGGYAYKSTAYVPHSRNQVIRLGNIKQGNFLPDEKQVFIPDNLANETAQYQIGANDILVSMTGTRRKKDYFFAVLINENMLGNTNYYLNQRVGCFRAFTRVLPQFLCYVLSCEIIRESIFTKETGTANQGNLGSEDIKKFVYIPLPPLAEQKRIVAKIEQLLPLCDKLK